MSAGIGLFLGTSGDNKPHKHWAHQVVVGLGNKVEVAANGIHRADGLWIPAGISHQLKHGEVLSLYIDPTHELSATLKTLTPYCGQSVNRLAPTIVDELVTCVSRTDDLPSALQAFQALHPHNSEKASDERIRRVLERLRQDVISAGNTPRNQLAELAYLSPSRFSHWFSEQTGLPLRSYKKWLKLLVGFELSRQMPLAAAASAAGFSDQAHFCRSITQAFGVSSSTIRQLLSEK